LKNKNLKTFIYLIPKKRKKNFNENTEIIIIREFEKLNHKIIPISRFYFINIILKYFTNKIDGIIVNSIRILNKNQLLLKFNTLLPIYWWYFDNPFLKKKNYERSIKLAKQVSVYFNKHYNHFQLYKQMGINTFWLDQGITSDYNFQNSDKYKYDIIFLGSLNSVHNRRTRILKNIDQNFNLTIFSPTIDEFRKLDFKNVMPPISHKNISRVVASSKITLVLNATTNEDFCWSNRIHLMLGSGAFCFTDYINGLEKSYENEKDCIFIKDLNKINDNIQYWLKDENHDKRQTIRLNGFKKAHKMHSYKNRINDFLNIINEK